MRSDARGAGRASARATAPRRSGLWRLRAVLYRPDRVRRPRTHLPVRAIRQRDGWCDAPADRNYNRPVRHPYPASAERLWRDGRALRHRRRAGLQRPPSRARPRQRHLHARGQARICADRGLHRARAPASVASARADGIASRRWLCGPQKKRPKLSLRASGARTGEVACSDKRRGPMERGPRRKVTLSSCKRARRDRRGRGPRAPGRCRAAGPPAPSRS